MNKIAFITTNRADYYLLEPIIVQLKSEKEISTELIVTGSHLLKGFGKTIDDINIPIDHIIHFDEDSTSRNLMSSNHMLTSIMDNSNKLFSKHKPDFAVLLGDRFEVAGIAMVLFNLEIPILHIYGGEVTLGSKDNTYRYLISLMSTHHFVSNSLYKRNLINFGIDSKKIYEIGYISHDLIENVKYLTLEEMFTRYRIDKKYMNYYAVLSLHPPTKEKVTVFNQIEIIDKIFDYYKDVLFVVTASNIDSGGDQLNEWYLKQSKLKTNLVFIPNLGYEFYINFIRNSLFVMGNSSSLLTDVPILKKAAILLGNRQEGRYSLGDLKQCDYDLSQLIKTIDGVLNQPMKDNYFEQSFSSKHRFCKILSNILEAESNC